MDKAAILALNAASEIETSALDAAGLDHLLSQAFYVGLSDEGRMGFLIALDQNAPYDNANHRWFRARYSEFVYVDRIIVASSARGKGIARALYEGLFQACINAGHRLVTCEINIHPPNPASMAFHKAMGFEVVGQQLLSSGKTVAYMAKSLENTEPTLR